jgi:hypothetical protein
MTIDLEQWQVNPGKGRIWSSMQFTVVSDRIIRESQSFDITLMTQYKFFHTH